MADNPAARGPAAGKLMNGDSEKHFAGGRNAKDRPARKDGHARQDRTPLREDVSRIDQSILTLLLKRYNLLEKMRVKGRLPVADEKFLREKWQASVTRISKDADLSSRFFAMMQDIKFMPRPESWADAGNKPESPPQPKTSVFNIAPRQTPVCLSLAAPCDSLEARAWIYMAAASGQQAKIAPAPQNECVDDCMRAFEQLGAKFPGAEEMARVDFVKILPAPPMGRPDRVLYAGNSEFNFFILLAHYLGRPSRVKITGDTRLKIADYSAIRHLLPALGARIVHVVPKSNGLPVRLECSGLLPPGIAPGADISAKFAMALLLAAPFYDNPFAVNLNEHPAKEEILTRVLPILEDCGVSFSVDVSVVSIEPSPVNMPTAPLVPMSPEMAAFILALAAPRGGKARLAGLWPSWPQTRNLLNLAAALNLPWMPDDNGIESSMDKGLAVFPAESRLEGLLKEEWQCAFVACIAACAVLNGGKASLPGDFNASEEFQDFLRAASLGIDESGNLRVEASRGASIWNAQSPAWAAALAVAAVARKDKQGFQLGNPGIMRELWSPFWKFYNETTNPPAVKEDAPPLPGRRRILTGAVAVPPEIREEDWD